MAHPLRLMPFLSVYLSRLRWSAALANGQAGWRLSVRQKTGFHRKRRTFRFSDGQTHDYRIQPPGSGLRPFPFVPEDVRAHPPERWQKASPTAGLALDIGNRWRTIMTVYTSTARFDTGRAMTEDEM